MVTTSKSVLVQRELTIKTRADKLLAHHKKILSIQLKHREIFVRRFKERHVRLNNTMQTIQPSKLCHTFLCMLNSYGDIHVAKALSYKVHNNYTLCFPYFNAIRKSRVFSLTENTELYNFLVELVSNNYDDAILFRPLKSRDKNNSVNFNAKLTEQKTPSDLSACVAKPLDVVASGVNVGKSTKLTTKKIAVKKQTRNEKEIQRLYKLRLAELQSDVDSLNATLRELSSKMENVKFELETKTKKLKSLKGLFSEFEHLFSDETTFK